MHTTTQVISTDILELYHIFTFYSIFRIKSVKSNPKYTVKYDLPEGNMGLTMQEKQPVSLLKKRVYPRHYDDDIKQAR